MKAYISILLVGFGLLAVSPPANGADWALAGSTGGGMTDALAVKGNILFAATRKAGVLLSTDDGASWRKAGMGLPAEGQFQSLAVIDANVFVASREHGIYLSTNNGGWWKAVNTGLPGLEVFSIAANGTDLFAGTPKGLFRSSDNGTSWTAVDLGSPAAAPAYCLVCLNGTIAVKTGEEMLSSRDGGATWTSVKWAYPTDVSIFCLLPTNVGLFAGTDTLGILVCRNGQDRWQLVKSKAGRTETHCLLSNGTVLLAGTGGGHDLRLADGVMTHVYHGLGVLRSVDDGAEWNDMNAGLRSAPKWPMLQGRVGFWVESLAANGSYLFAGTDGGEVWRRPLSEIAPEKK